MGKRATVYVKVIPMAFTLIELEVLIFIRLNACLWGANDDDYDTIRYDTIEEINVDSKAEYTA